MKTILSLLLLFIVHQNFAQTPYMTEMDGTDDYILIGDVNDLGTSNFTIECWFYIDSYTGNANQLLSKGATSVGTPSNAGYSLRVGYTNPMELDFAVHGDGGSFYQIFHPGIQEDQWYHVAAVRRTDILLLYVDCQLVGTQTIPANLNVDTNIPLSIGAKDKGGLSFVDHYMDGHIDEVRIWNTDLPDSVICDQKDCVIDSPKPNLIAVYNMDHSTGTIATDNSGNGNDGVCQNGSGWATSTVALTNCDSTASANEIKQEAINLMLYPNPASNEFVIQGLNYKAEFEIHDSKGAVVMSGNLLENQPIDISDLRSGIYWIRIYSFSALVPESIKFIKE